MAKLSDLGAAALAAAATDGTKVSFRKIKIGDGGGIVPVFNGSETSLVNEVTEIDVTAVYRRTENPNYIYIEGVIPFNNGGYTIREACAVDDLGRCLVIGDYAEVPKPADTSPHAREILIRMVAVIENNISVINLFSFAGNTGSVVSGGYPVGTTVDNYFSGSDAGAPAWVKLGLNVSADIRLYPKVENLLNQADLQFYPVLKDVSFSAIRSSVAGYWSCIQWKILNGIHVVVLLETAGTNNYYRTVISSDGISFSAGGNAVSLGAIPASSTKVKLYYLNGKSYMVTPVGVFQSSDGCVTWVRKTANNYCSMWYMNGLYLFGGPNDNIFKSTDLVTFTSVYSGGDGVDVTGFIEFDGRYFASKYVSGSQMKFLHSSDLSAWSELVVGSYVHVGPIQSTGFEVFNGQLHLIGFGSGYFSVFSDTGIDGWAKSSLTGSGSSSARNTAVAGDTLYTAGGFAVKRDGVILNRTVGGLSISASGGGFCLHNGYVYYGVVTSTNINVFRFPVTDNEYKVYLPFIENKAMKVL